MMMTLREAGKHIGRSREFVRSLIMQGKLTAYRFGGRDTAPRLKVNRDELEQAYRLATVYRPPSAARKERSRVSGGKLDPFVAGWS